MLFVLALILSYASGFMNPEHFWQFAFFGLFYPLFLLINLGFVLFWLWRKKWYFLLSGIIILLGWPNIGKYLQVNLFSKRKTDFESIRVLSYNVRLFNYYEWEKNEGVRDEIMEFLKGQNISIACFQEFFTQSDEEGDSEESIDKALASLPYKHIFYTYKPNEFSNYGIATYSKYPILKKGSIRFKNSFNACIYTDLKLEDDTVRVFNVHLQSIKFKKNDYDAMDRLRNRFNAHRIDEVKEISGRLKTAYMIRAQQVDELRWHIDQSPYPVIICGDFNDTPVSYTYHQVRGNLEDAFIGSGRGIGNTYRGKLPSFRIDFIFHSPRFKSVNYQTHRIELSDHYPVSCGLYRIP